LPGDEVTLEEIYAEVDKRIAAAVAAIDAKLAEMAKRLPPEKKPFRVLREKQATS
jgi:hypothetical protein